MTTAVGTSGWVLQQQTRLKLSIRVSAPSAKARIAHAKDEEAPAASWAEPCEEQFLFWRDRHPEKLLAFIKDESANPFDRAAACEVAGGMPDSSGILSRLAFGPNEMVAQGAIAALSTEPNRSTLQLMEDLASTTSSPVVRDAADAAVAYITRIL